MLETTKREEKQTLALRSGVPLTHGSLKRVAEPGTMAGPGPRSLVCPGDLSGAYALPAGWLVALPLSVSLHRYTQSEVLNTSLKDYTLKNCKEIIKY